MSQKMLERDPFAAFFERFPERTEILLIDRSVELEIEIHPGDSQLMGHQHLHIASGVLNSPFLKIAGSAIDGFQHSAHFGDSGAAIGAEADSG
jgi:hypothetical protein